MSEDFIEQFMKRHLKELGSKAIEDAIKKAICDLTGVEYVADIVSINFEEPHHINDDGVEIKLRLHKYREPFRMGENA